MLSKLSYRNVKRSIKDYLIYLITVTLSFSFIFAFNLISNSKDVIELSSTMANFKYAMYITNIFIVLVVCYLVNYTTKFIFQKRSKEFGTYLILGMEKKQIARMFTLENLIFGFFALLISLPVGYLFSIIMSSIIMNVFDVPGIAKMRIGLMPVLLTLICFIAIYFFVLLFARRRINKMKIHDLLYYDKQNEKGRIKKVSSKSIFFIISVIIGVASLIIFDWQFRLANESPSMFTIFMSIVGIIVSIYGVTITVSDFILNFILKRKRIKYRKDNLFVSRTFSSKIRTMSFTMGTLTVLITLTLLALNMSSLFKGVFDYQLKMVCPYDISIELDEEDKDKYLEAIKKYYTIDDMAMYNEYNDSNNNVSSELGNGGSWGTDDGVIRLSDYNTLCQMRGMKTISLEEGEYYLLINREFRDKLESNTELDEITLPNNIMLKKKGCSTDGYSRSVTFGFGFDVIVPDSAVLGLEVSNYHMIVNTKEETTEDFSLYLSSVIRPDLYSVDENGNVTYYSLRNALIRGEEIAQNKGFMTIIAFICYYVAFIFTAVVGTIFAIQSLSDSTKYKYRYNVLNKLGVGETKLHRTVFKQLFVFFAFPIIYPIIVSICTITSMNRIFQFALSDTNIYLAYFGINLGLFLIVYIIYFIATYFGFKKNIDLQQ